MKFPKKVRKADVDLYKTNQWLIMRTGDLKAETCRRANNNMDFIIAVQDQRPATR